MFVNHPGSVTHHDIVAACVKLRHAGFVPLPHVAARRLASYTQARDFLQRAAGDAAVSRLLLIGGDPAPPAGPFRDAADLLASGLVESNGIGHVALAGYPEGHPRIDRRSLDAALRAKLALAQQRGLDASLITQFGFAAAPIVRWIASLREEGIVCPVRVGVAGPASDRDPRQIRGPLRHRRVAARARPRANRLCPHPRRSHPRRADRFAGRGRRGRRPARRSPRLHLWRRPPDGRMDPQPGARPQLKNWPSPPGVNANFLR